MISRFGILPTSYRSQKLSGLEKSRKSLWGSLRGIPADPQKESKTSLRETLRVTTSPLSSLETHFFDSFWGVGRDPSYWEPPGRAQRAPRALRARNPKRVRKESVRVSRALRPQGSPRVLKECAPESEKSRKRVRSCLFGLSSDFGAHGPKGPGSPLCQAGGS